MSTLKPALNARDHLRGPLSAPLQLVEFADYECPFCARAYPVTEALCEAFGDRLCFGSRHFPIVGVHAHALLAAEAAEAAGAQGKFWEMHSMLFTHQGALEVPDLERYAGLLGLDVRQLVSDLRTHRFIDKIRTDLHSGAISGVNGTPTFFVNGLRHDGNYDFDSLYAALTGGAGAEVPV
jgi:protein-disulfide isomerase